jgi:hypothetical protein
MSGNSIAISRELLAAGVEQKTASAVAEAIVTHSDERHATREDLIRLEANLQKQLSKLEAKVDAETKKNDMRFNFIIGLLIALCAGVFVILLQLPFGG